MAARGDLIAQFIEITGSDENVARFYLSSCDWDLEQALGNYWSTQADAPPTPTNVGQADNPAPTSSSGKKSVGADVKNFSPTSKPKFATLSDMSKQPSSDDEHQVFYAGGSDRSGQQVLGPPKRKNFREQLTDMMRTAQEQNIAEVMGPSTSASATVPGNSGSVWGQGMRLGMTENDHTAVGAANRSGQTADNKPVVVLKLWSQGFSIDGGELRHYDDPQNKEFLETVMRGEIPQELLEMGRMVNVDVEDHRHEEFKRQAAAPTFKGSGQKLGSPVANIVSNEGPAAPAKSEDAANQEASARDAINLNSEAPMTTLQIRLADGSRLAAQFNLTHTVSDIRRFIQNARPQYINSNFVLVSSFPTRELNDESFTIEKAGLKNAALMQRLK